MVVCNKNYKLDLGMHMVYLWTPCIQWTQARVPTVSDYEPVLYYEYCSLYISLGTDEENLLNNQELLQLMTIFSILVT